MAFLKNLGKPQFILGETMASYHKYHSFWWYIHIVSLKTLWKHHYIPLKPLYQVMHPHYIPIKNHGFISFLARHDPLLSSRMNVNLSTGKAWGRSEREKNDFHHGKIVVFFSKNMGKGTKLTLKHLKVSTTKSGILKRSKMKIDDRSG